MGHGEQVLIIGRHTDMLQNIKDLLARNGYIAFGALTNEDAVSTFTSNSIDAVVIGGGVDNTSRMFFHREFPMINPQVHIIDAHPQTVLTDLQAAFQGKHP